MNIEQARTYCLSKPYATEDMPFGDDYVAFRIGGKIFAGLPLMHHNELVLKCNPAEFDELVETYSAIEQAWHWHKRHWIQIDLSDVLISDEFIHGLIDRAYEVVVAKMTKKQRTELFG